MLFKLVVSITQFVVILPTCPFRRDGSHIVLHRVYKFDPMQQKALSSLLLKKSRFLQYLTQDLTSFPMIPIPENESDTFGNTTLYKVCISFFHNYFVHFLRIKWTTKCTFCCTGSQISCILYPTTWARGVAHKHCFQRHKPDTMYINPPKHTIYVNTASVL